MTKQFRGWVTTKHSHKPLLMGNVMGLAQVTKQPGKQPSVALERIVYIGCIHGGNSDIYERLRQLARHSPDYVIFAGDTTGSPTIERFKKHFYDTKAKNPQSQYRNYPYFGDWVATWSREKREALLQTLPVAAEQLLAAAKRLKQSGATVYFLEGNWDNSLVSGIKVIAKDDIKSVFNTKAYFAKHGFTFIDHITTIKTTSTLHIFLPYYFLLHFDKVTKDNIQTIKQATALARKQGKHIIMVGHAEANWQIHTLAQASTFVQNDRDTVIKHFGRAMALFTPDEVIYPHQHARIRDEHGALVDLNAKYVLQVYGETVRLVKDVTEHIHTKQIIATYVPFGFLAEEDFLIL